MCYYSCMSQEKPKLIWWVVVPAMVLPLISALFYFVFFAGQPFAQVIYVGTKLFTLVWPAVVVLAIYRDGLPTINWRSPHHWRSLPLGIISGLAIVALMVGLMLTPLGDVAQRGSSQIATKSEEMGILAHYWLFALFISVLHSLLEEYYWRWFVYGQLERLTPPVAAHLLAGVAFAAHHVVIISEFFGVFWGFFFSAFVGIGGIIWSLMLARQKTLMGIWVSHMIVDFGAMGVGYWLIQQAGPQFVP